MPDWQHEMRNQLNLMMYASNWARDALAQGHTDDVLHSLARIENAIAECGGLLEHFKGARAPAPNVPGQPEAGQAG